MKVLLYSGFLQFVTKSGVGESVRHQAKILEYLAIPYTSNYREDFDIIHVNTIFPDAFIMSRLAKWNGKKVIYYAHSTMEDFRNSFRGSNRVAPLFKRWLRHCYNSGDIIITPTEYSKNLLENYRLKRPIFSLSNGVDADFFAENPASRERFRGKYSLSDEEKVVLSVGHYIERKGILDFVKIAEDMPEYQFYWFGYTNLNLVPKKIRRAISCPPPNLHFPGYVNRNELRDAYCGSDLFLFLTNEETEGIVLLEALAAKISVLVRDIPIYSNWLVDGESAYKGNNIRDFEEKIVQIVSGEVPDTRGKGHLVALNCDLKVIGEKLMNIYRQ